MPADKQALFHREGNYGKCVAGVELCGVMSIERRSLGPDDSYRTNQRRMKWKRMGIFNTLLADVL